MASSILNILDEFQLNTDIKVQERLSQFTNQDWLSLLDRLDAHYDNIPIPSANNSLTPLTFCFPILPIDILPSLSKYALFADRVYLDDPLYTNILELADDPVSVFSNFPSLIDWTKKHGISEHGIKLYAGLGKEALLSNIAKSISFYLRAHDLLQEQKLVIYKPNPSFVTKAFLDSFLTNLIEDNVKSPSTSSLSSLLPNHSSSNLLLLAQLRIVQLGVKLRLFSKEKHQSHLMKLVKPYSIEMNNFLPFMTSLMSFAVGNDLYGLSTDFIQDKFALAYRKLVELASNTNTKLPIEKQIKLPSSFSMTGIRIPVLENIPMEAALDVIASEPDIFQLFRSTLNEKLMQISAPSGSIERERQILSINESIARNIKEIDSVYRDIQNSFRKKFVFHTLLGGSSIFVAGFSTLGQNLDTLSIASSVFAGATLSASIKDFVKEWLEYEQDIGKLKSKENYFIWKATSKTAKKFSV